MVTEYLDHSTAPWPVTVLALAFLLLSFAFGLSAAVFPIKVAKLHSRLIYRMSVVNRGGREFVLPEHIIMLGARSSDEALAKLRMMIDDPARAAPGRVFLTRALGLFLVVFCPLALAAVLFGQFLG